MALTITDIQAALKRVQPYVHRTPVFHSVRLNQQLGHEIFFKMENLQRVGAFKARGAMNTLCWLQEREEMPTMVAAHSSGNHAQAVAWACKYFGIVAHIFMPENVSKIKARATRSYGAQVHFCKTRPEAEALAQALVKEGAVLVPPYDHDQIICGQGTACLEAMEQIAEPIDAIFVPCGGGGLLSGTVIAAKGTHTQIKVYGGEPLVANDAAQSLANGMIFSWTQTPATIADGVRSLSISERTFQYLKMADGIFEISEEEILSWTQWLCHLLKTHCEPTSALGMAAASRWLKTQKLKRKVLIILSGGNMDNETLMKIWSRDRLEDLPI